jgi:8-hydroxy-5-deazaflavin:NADPH oxidoreductase
VKFGVLGTGMVGAAVGGKLASLGHEVTLGSRDPIGKAAVFPSLRVGTAQDAAAFGEIVVNALPGEQSLLILRGCDLAGKIVIDIGNYDSAVDQPIITPLGQAIQALQPKARVVKTLNSVSAHLMVDPQRLQGHHSVFIASDDAEAKQVVKGILVEFGWKDIVDLGGQAAFRAMEQLIPLWMALESTLGSTHFSHAVVQDGLSPKG